MSNCNKFSELLNAYADDEATNEEKILVEKHISECEKCKQKLDFILKTKEILNNTPSVPVPETLLADFAEFKKKQEESEKKVVPFYKNYRMYASIAAVFVFAFVLKSGLWQEDKYLPEQPATDTYGQQTLVAVKQEATEETQDENIATVSEASGDAENAENTSATEKHQASKTVESVNSVQDSQPVQQSNAKTITNDSISTQEISEPAPSAEAAVSEPTPELAAFNDEESASSGGGSSATYSRMSDQAEAVEIKDTAQAIENLEIQEEQTTLNAQIYVSEQHLEKAQRLLSGGPYFFSQVEQKMSDNRIPFESNFLLLDESKPYHIQVMVKSE